MLIPHANGYGLSIGPSMLVLLQWHIGHLNCNVRLVLGRLYGMVMEVGREGVGVEKQRWPLPWASQVPWRTWY